MASRGSGKAVGGGGAKAPSPQRAAKDDGEGEGEWWREPLWQGVMIAGGAVVVLALGAKYLLGSNKEEKGQTGKAKGKVRRHVQALVVDPDMTVKVNKGDTLWRLSQKYEVLLDALRSANPDVRGDELHAGSRLYIPNVIADEEFDVAGGGD